MRVAATQHYGSLMLWRARLSRFRLFFFLRNTIVLQNIILSSLALIGCGDRNDHVAVPDDASATMKPPRICIVKPEPKRELLFTDDLQVSGYIEVGTGAWSPATSVLGIHVATDKKFIHMIMSASVPLKKRRI